MLVPAANALNPSCLPAALTKSRVYRLHSPFGVNNRKQHVTVICSAKFPGMEHFNEPTKLIALLNYTKEKLWKSVPGSVKSFPWKKAESVALHELLILGKETLKWSLLVYFALSSLSDILYSISRNKEFVIPFGLFVGTIVAKYIDEINQEFMPDQKDSPVSWRLAGISCFLVLVKVISSYFSGGNDFLLHCANGGLMQVLWNWKNLPELDGENSVQGTDASTPQES